MVATRRIAVVVLLGALAAALSGPAAARPNLAAYPESISTPHFEVHFTGAITSPANPERITFQTAGDLAALAERAYDTLVTGWGYPEPLNDADGRTDIFVQDLSASDVLGLAVPDAAGNTATGAISIDVAAATSHAVIAHELMHLIQFGIWIPADSWLLEGSAEWAGFSASGFSPFGGVPIAATLAAPDMSLDCASDACGNDLYETGGYSRWAFFQYLSERYGTGFVKDVLGLGATLANPLETSVVLLWDLLLAKSTTLSAVFDDYVLTHLIGGYQTAALKGMVPTTYSTTPTGSASGALPVQRVAVNHLAARYLKFTRGDASDSGCHPATLSLTVGLPDNLGAKPAFYSSSLGSSPIPLTISGGTASLTVPWDTCTARSAGYLSLPNASMTSDAETFTVSGSLSVDLSAVPPAGPPAPLWTGTTVAAPTGEVAPSIFVYGAQLVRVAAATRVVRLIIFSSGPGKLEATLASTRLGAFTLRAGNNDVRFRLPASVVKALRSTASSRAASSLLTLTSFSTEGTKGTTVTRKVAITRAKRR